MSSTNAEGGKPAEVHNSADADVKIERGVSQEEHAYDLDKKAKVSDYKSDAIDAENAEYNMGVLEAVKAYPMATFWAFVMSFTIVSYLVTLCSTRICPPRTHS